MSSRGSSSASVPPLEIGRQRSPSPSARKQKSSPRDSSGLRKQVLSGSSNTGMHSRGLSSGSRPSLVECTLRTLLTIGAGLKFACYVWMYHIVFYHSMLV